MTVKKDLKKRIRARQAKTGESYTTARSHVLKARGPESEDQGSGGEGVTAIVLKCNQQSMRIRVPGEDAAVTFRSLDIGVMQVVPGQFVDVTLAKRWTWHGDAYASGAIRRAWIDVPALGLDPLPLSDQGVYDLSETYGPYRRPDPYAEMWEFFASTPRSAFEFDGIAWGVGVGVDEDDHSACLVSDAAEIGRQDPAAARDLLMTALLADLRCIDAHAHLGIQAFDHWPEDAITHYEIALGIGELSLGPSFDGILPWGYLYNRPFLRALHGYGLCLWRLNRIEQATQVFERALALNPADNQGIRFSWNDVRNGLPWTPDEETNDLASLVQGRIDSDQQHNSL